MLSFSVESSVFNSAFEIYKDSDIQKNISACCLVWVQNMFYHTEGGTQTDDV